MHASTLEFLTIIVDFLKKKKKVELLIIKKTKENNHSKHKVAPPTSRVT